MGLWEEHAFELNLQQPKEGTDKFRRLGANPKYMQEREVATITTTIRNLAPIYIVLCDVMLFTCNTCRSSVVPLHYYYRTPAPPYKYSMHCHSGYKFPKDAPQPDQAATQSNWERSFISSK